MQYFLYSEIVYLTAAYFFAIDIDDIMNCLTTNFKNNVKRNYFLTCLQYMYTHHQNLQTKVPMKMQPSRKPKKLHAYENGRY